jgi:tripartite-type tricarboxylate transporter receptor subunit TctC
MLRKGLVLVLIVSFSVFALVGCGSEKKAEAPKFPNKAISIIVPFAAGGGTDAVGRALAKSAETVFGQPVTVVNKVGANGATGTTDGLNSPADGYTVTMSTVEIAMNPILGNVTWKPSDFKAVILLNTDVAAVTVNADSPYKTFQDFINDAKANPGKLKVGANAPGAIWHLAALDLQEKAGVKFNLIPFPGGAGPAITDLLGGHIDAVTVSAAEVSQHVKAGKLRILAVMSKERAKGFSDIPTVKEQGIDVQVTTWRGLAVPGKTPDSVVKALHDGFKKAMDDPKFVEFMDKGNFGIGYMNSADYQKFMNDELDKFRPLLEKAGLAKK